MLTFDILNTKFTNNGFIFFFFTTPIMWHRKEPIEQRNLVLQI